MKNDEMAEELPIENLAEAQCEDLKKQQDDGDDFEDDGNIQGRQSIMVVKPTDHLQEIKERCFTRLNEERHNLIKQRRQMSGYGTYSKQKGGVQRKSMNTGPFQTPSDRDGLISKRTKQVAAQVDNELLTDHDLMARIMEEERGKNLPELTEE